jgi:hypothetical protein
VQLAEIWAVVYDYMHKGNADIAINVSHLHLKGADAKYAAATWPKKRILLKYQRVITATRTLSRAWRGALLADARVRLQLPTSNWALRAQQLVRPAPHILTAFTWNAIHKDPSNGQDWHGRCKGRFQDERRAYFHCLNRSHRCLAIGLHHVGTHTACHLQFYEWKC